MDEASASSYLKQITALKVRLAKTGIELPPDPGNSFCLPSFVTQSFPPPLHHNSLKRFFAESIPGFLKPVCPDDFRQIFRSSVKIFFFLVTFYR